MPRARLIEHCQAPRGYLVFDCPGCRTGHCVSVQPTIPNGWRWNGDFDRPTLEPSFLVNADLSCPGAPRCHSFVRDGEIQFLPDSTHTLAGQTVALPEIPS